MFRTRWNVPHTPSRAPSGSLDSKHIAIKKAKKCFNIVLTCVVLHNMLRTHQGRADKEPIPANDVAALQNEQVVYVPNENYRNYSREAKHQ